MYRNILVPVSFDEDRNARAAMEVAGKLADADAQITLLHVMEQVPGYAINYMPGDYLAQSRAAVEEALAQQAAGLKGAEAVVIDGHSGRSILDYAARIKADCIVIASHRPGMQDYLLGGTAAQVVRHAPCAVHVIR